MLDPQTERALAHISLDPVMARLIEERGPLALKPDDDHFFSLVDSICSQQLSSKVAATIVARIRALVPGEAAPSARSILELPDQTLRDIGLSWRKVSYIKDLAARVHSGELPFHMMDSMEDEEIIQALLPVKGIGRWTAEMFLMFSLGRPDVLAVDDYGLQAAMMRLYGLPALPKPAQMRAIAEPWKPYRSYGSLYLWRSHDNSPKVAAMEVPQT